MRQDNSLNRWMIVITVLLGVLPAITEVRAQSDVATMVCGTYETLMGGQIFQYREVGVPVGAAEEIFNTEDDVRTRVFLKRFVRTVYADPETSRRLLDSGEFLQACVKTYRGF